MANKKTARLRLGRLNDYALLVLGHIHRSGQSPYTLAAAALIQDAQVDPPQENESARAFVKRHTSLIRKRLAQTEARERITTIKEIKSEARKQAKAVAVPAPAAPASDAFLKSYAWRRLRMEVLKKYGARCQCCGATAATGATICVDHIRPRKVAPQLALDIENLQVLCGACNHGKGNWDETDWRPKSTDTASPFTE